MKRPMALVGFTTLLALLVALFFGERISLIISAVSLIFFTYSLLCKTIRKGKIIPIAFLAISLSTGLFAAESERISCVNDLHGATATISGIVDDLPYEENENYCCLIKVETIEGFSFPENGRVLVYASEPIVNGPGDRVEGEMRFLLPNAQQGFGTRASLAANHIYLYAFPVDEGTITRPGTVRSLWTTLLHWKLSLYDVVDSLYSPSDASMVKGLLFGDKHTVSDDIQDAYRAAGVSHILAVSGFHLVIVTQMLTVLLQAFRVPRRLRPFLSAVCILLFMALAGFSASVLRSGIMCLILLLGNCFSRKPDALNSLGFAVWILCLNNPFAAADAGLLLSVSATAGLILTSGRIQHALDDRTPREGVWAIVLRPIKSVLATSISGTLFTLPLLVLLFGTISPLSLLANLLMVYASSLMLQSAAISLLLGILFPPLAALPVLCTSWLNGYLTLCATWISGIPLAVFYFTGRAAYLWVGCCFALLGLAVLLGKGKPRLQTASLLCVILLLTSLLGEQIALRNVTTISVLPSGDGIATVVTKNRHAAVIGCSGHSRSEVVTHLNTKHTVSLDLIVMAGETFEEGSNAGAILSENSCGTLLCRRESLANGMLLGNVENAGEIRQYDAGYSVSLWDGAVTIERKGAFLRLLCGTESILYWPKDAEADELPESWDDCTILLLEELPDKLEGLQPNFGIFCMDEDSVSRVWSVEYPFLPVTTADGTVEIRIQADGTTQLRREP